MIALGWSSRLPRVSLSAALVAAALALSASQPDSAGAAWTPVHDYRGVVPVLCYHGLHANIQPSRDPYSISGSEFARQMAMLSQSGFHAISIAQYARFAAGDIAGLPSRPILITFDDGRVDSFAAADPVLAREGMRATMFVITANAAAPKAGYLGWPQLAAMAASGRWDPQVHAHAGHVLIPTGPGGRTGPYYANLLYRDGVRERFTAFKRRVSEDILTGRRLMASQVPGFEPLAFAVPYDNYGQLRTNYAPIPVWESGWLARTFKVFFLQDRRVYNLPGNPVGQRYGIHATTTAEILHQWLLQALPRSAWTNPATPAPPPARSPRRPKRPSVRKLLIGRHVVVIVLRLRDAAALRVTRRRAGHRRKVAVPASTRGRVRDRRLHPGRLYVYRLVAVSAAGRHSRALVLRVHTRR